MPFKCRDIWTIQKDILPGLGSKEGIPSTGLLFDLNFKDFGWVEYYFGDGCGETGTDLADGSFEDVKE